MGRVTYLDGAGVEQPAANVDVTSIPQCGEATKTDADGNYELGSGCPIGVYTIVFSGTGFRTLTVPNISITAGREYILNVQLQTGTGPVVPPGEGVATVEQCAGCHMGTVAEKHALQRGDAVQVSNISAVTVVNTTDVQFTFNVKVNGVNRIDFIQKAQAMRNHNEDAWWYYDAATKAGVRTKLGTGAFGSAAGTWQFVGTGNGNYRVTISGLAATAHAMDAGTAYMVSIMGPDEMTATAVAYVAGTLPHDVVGNESCMNCHGNHIWKGLAHDVTSPQGVGPCVVCHNRDGALETRLTGYMPAGNSGGLPVQAALPGTAGTGLMGIVHGIHNAKNMPDGTYTWVWPSNGNATNFTNGFPGNMNNCETCHNSTARLAQVMAAPVSYALCVSCHDGLPNAPASHATFTPLGPWFGMTTCTVCHPGTVASFHNGQETERAGLIYDGADQSIVLARDYKVEITGVTVNGTNLVVTWTAKNPNTGVAYDPCNRDFAAGPVFFGYVSPLNRTEGCTNTAGGCNSNFDFLQSFAQADDWVNDAVTGSSAPGQPAAAAKLTTDATKDGYTTCDAATKVATTLVARKTTAATKGILALEGKPQQRFAPTNTIVWVRAQTATREFVVADGAAPATQRRTLVDVNKCNACHYGTLYQHGGSRVDSIELCVMCHNPASSEQNRRVGMGVTADEAYDGLAGQTYDMRYMVHAIHAAGENGKQLMFYRSNGIYFFGSKATLATVPNWPLNGSADQCISCVDVEDGPLTFCKVYGSAATGEKPVANPDGTCGTPVASSDGTWRPHRVVEVEYPRALNDCGACHVAGAVDGLPDPTMAVGVTFDTGASTTYNVLVDDVLMGPSAASCMSCHRSGDAATQSALQNHAGFFGWDPAVFPDGRQTLIDAAQ
jgi:OmcA/MtrC family decaheme c-type cytochrome